MEPTLKKLRVVLTLTAQFIGVCRWLQSVYE